MFNQPNRGSAHRVLVSAFLQTLIGLLPLAQDTVAEAQPWVSENLQAGGSLSFNGVMITLMW